VALAAGRVELAQGPAAAIEVVDKASLDLTDPANFDALEARTRLLVGLDRHDEAVAGIEKARAKDPKSARLLVLRATVARDLGKLDQAIADLEAARQLDGASSSALLELASVQEQAGRHDVASHLYEEAIALAAKAPKRDEPTESKASIALARIELAAGKVDAARRHLRATLDQNPRQGEAAWLLLESYADDASSDELDEKVRKDLALRAAVFGRTPEAQAYYKKLNAKAS
jgi:tetratricopeptide (TPR) repeat protein